MSALKNRTRHNIPLDIAFKAVAENGEIPVNLNDLVDNHHYVTVPGVTTVIIGILITPAAAIVIKRMRVEVLAVAQTVSYQMAAYIAMQENVRHLENAADEHKNRTRKPHAPQPPLTAPLPMIAKPPRMPPLYATASPQMTRVLIGSITATGSEHARACSSSRRTFT